MHKKIKAFENERADGYFSGLWGGRSAEQKEKDEKGNTSLFCLYNFLISKIL